MAILLYPGRNAHSCWARAIASVNPIRFGLMDRRSFGSLFLCCAMALAYVSYRPTRTWISQHLQSVIFMSVYWRFITPQATCCCCCWSPTAHLFLKYFPRGIQKGKQEGGWEFMDVEMDLPPFLFCGHFPTEKQTPPPPLKRREEYLDQIRDNVSFPLLLYYIVWRLVTVRGENNTCQKGTRYERPPPIVVRAALLPWPPPVGPKGFMKDSPRFLSSICVDVEDVKASGQ